MIKTKIYKTGKSATQSGLGKAGTWILEYEPRSPRVPESLMGWVSSADTLGQVSLKFSSCERAKAFAEHEGLFYTVLPPHERKIKPRNYSDNFRYIPAESQESP